MPSVGGGYVHAGGAARLDANAGDDGPGEHGEIRAPQSRYQHPTRAGIPTSTMDGAPEKPRARGSEAGEIIAASIAANRRKSIEKRLIQTIGFRDESNVDGSV